MKLEGTAILTKSDIEKDLRANLGIKDGDIIAVHSSMKSLGAVDGGPATFIKAMIDSIGGLSKGTLMMPCFNGPHDTVDLRSTPCRLGLVPETFRTFSGVVRSENHTHSVAAIGKHAKDLVKTHKGKAPLGIGSPFHELAKMGGWIVHIGCDMRSCSIVHVAESIANAPYLHIAYPDYDKTIKLVVSDNESYDCHPTENPGCSRNFNVVQDELDRLGLIIKGRVGAAESMKILANNIIDVSIELIMGKGYDALLCDSPSCSVCTKKRAFLKENNHKMSRT